MKRLCSWRKREEPVRETENTLNVIFKPTTSQSTELKFNQGYFKASTLEFIYVRHTLTFGIDVGRDWESRWDITYSPGAGGTIIGTNYRGDFKPGHFMSFLERYLDWDPFTCHIEALRFADLMAPIVNAAVQMRGADADRRVELFKDFKSLCEKQSDLTVKQHDKFMSQFPQRKKKRAA